MSQTIDMDILNNILKNLVTQPEAIKVDRHLDELGVLLSIQVDPQDMGIVIGRNGAMATAIKTVMKAIGKANDMNLRVQFLEPDGSLKYNRKNPKAEYRTEEKPAQQIKQPSRSIKAGSFQDETPSLEDDLKDFVIN